MDYTIMIIDDEQMILDMLRDQFELENYRVITAKNSEEALHKLTQQPDIILLDINMPGMNGLDLCRAIQNHVTCPSLFLTARIEEADRVAGLQSGGDDYIIKPFSLAELTARVGAHLRRESRIQQKSVSTDEDVYSVDLKNDTAAVFTASDFSGSALTVNGEYAALETWNGNILSQAVDIS